ncbi:MAG: undecaprenyl/decaprenyl-phosphate alpha-N-acetylglucosaminyl 1-phosphate transferase, partial [Oligosphaeraceae bacterium]|nr:undecaprenyl/decaprenyl-phosphate alpha-N-acetylglucosaminyl 1-phosphate transferase [Oligosphaeraceae bacterium]
MPPTQINFAALVLKLWPSLLLMFLLTGLASLLLTRQCVKLFPRLGLLDGHTGGRHIHRQAVPRGGGLAMVLAYTTGLLGFSLWSERWGAFVLPLSSLLYFVPLLPLVVLGLLDDRNGISARWKLYCQLGVSLLAWYCGIRLETIGPFVLPPWLSIIATMFWITGMINAFNFIDGVDGLAGGIAVISSLCLGGVMLLQG